MKLTHGMIVLRAIFGVEAADAFAQQGPVSGDGLVAAWACFRHRFLEG